MRIWSAFTSTKLSAFFDKVIRLDECRSSWTQVLAVGSVLILVLLLFGPTGKSSPPANLRVNEPAQDDLAWDHTTQAEPSIAVFDDIVLIAFVNTGDLLPQEPGHSSLTGYARSTDGGDTFRNLGSAPAYGQSVGYSNPTLAVSSAGVFYLANIQQGPSGVRVGVARSEDGGLTFDSPVLVPRPPGASLAFSDLPQVAVDPETGFVYIVWTDLLLRQIMFSRSTDGGQTFNPPVALSSGSAPKHMARLAPGPDGHLYSLWLEVTLAPALPSPPGLECPTQPFEDRLYVSRSLDHGLSWSPGQPIATLYLPCAPENPPQCRPGVRGAIQTVPLPSPAVDSQTGELCIAFQRAAADGSDNSDVFFMALDPELNVLIPPKRVNDDTTQNDQFMPALAVSPQGEIGIIFYDRRLDPNNELIDVFFARSTDGGLSFINERVTTDSFPVPPIVRQPTRTGNSDDLRRACYMGDYNSIVADTEFFYLVWGDSRNIVKTPCYPEGRQDLDVYFAKIPTILRMGRGAR